MVEYRSIRLEHAVWRALKDHFAVKWRVYRLWDDFGHEPKERTVRDMIATCLHRGEQAKAVMDRLLGPCVARGVRMGYDRKVFKDAYGKERRERLTPEQRMEHASPEIKEIWTGILGVQKMVEDLRKSLDACEGAA